MPNSAPTTSYSITAAPLTADLTPNALPWAIDGTLLAPIGAQEAAGSAPYPSAPPIYSIENFRAYYGSQWLERLSACGFFAQRATSRITIGGTVTAGNTYTLDDGTNSDTYTATSADAAAGTPILSVVTNWAQQLRTSALRDTLSGSVGGTGLLDVIYRDPGTDWPAGTPTVSETGTGTIAIVDRYGGTAGQLSVFSAPAGTDVAGCDLLHGTASADGAAVKMQFRKGAKNGAFRAGKWTGAESDLANVGASSVAFGEDSVAASKAQIAVSAHKFGTVIGVNQWSDLHIWGQFTGASSAVLVPEAGDSGAIPIPYSSSITFEADVIGVDTSTGTLAASWRIRGTAAVDNTGVPTMTMLTSDAPVTISAQDLVVGVKEADWGGSDAPPFAYTGSGALQVGFAVGAKTWLAITGSGAVSMRFSGRFRYVIVGAG